jgi:hypothetical protein
MMEVLDSGRLWNRSWIDFLKQASTTSPPEIITSHKTRSTVKGSLNSSSSSPDLLSFNQVSFLSDIGARLQRPATL